MANIEPDANVEDGDYPVIKTAGATVHMIPEALFQLNVEIGEHGPIELLEYMARVTAASTNPTWVTKLAAVAAFVGIAIDGTYNAATLNKLADECRARLIKRRMPVGTTKSN